MSKTFVVSVDGDATKEQRDVFTNELRLATGVGFWHHIETTWIIRDPRASGFTSSGLRDRIRELMPLAYVTVMQVEPKNFASYGPDKGNEWLLKYFK